MGWPDAWDGFIPDEASLMRLGGEDAAVRWCEERYGADGSRFLEGDIDLPPADLELLADEAAGAVFVASLTEAFRQGVGGYAQDITVQAQPWSFDPTAITAPVRVLHGEADTLVPITHSRHTAELIPGATLVTLPDHGHLSLFNELPQLVAHLATSLR